MKLFTLRFRNRCVRFTLIAITLCMLVGVLLMINVENQEEAGKSDSGKVTPENLLLLKIKANFNNQLNKLTNFTKVDIRNFIANKPKGTKVFGAGSEHGSSDKKTSLNYNVHVFYYPWYGNPKHDGRFFHWNHPFIQHWKKMEADKWPSGEHAPPDDIGANFYPELGPYSSRDPKVIEKHMQEISSAGIGVVVVSWYPPNDADENGKDLDTLTPLILDIAYKYNVKVTLHIEPYTERNHITMRRNIKYILDNYGMHSAFYKHFVPGKSKKLPVFYIYDSYLVKPKMWAQILKPEGSMTVRNTELDAIFIGLLAEKRHKIELLTAGFDGFYTYFATDGFTYGSTWENWKEIAEFAKSEKMYFIPSVGPGYIDTNVRPWNSKYFRSRNGGTYFLNSFKSALKTSPQFISLTSFNEWHEGTQIEPAIPKRNDKLVYLDYGPQGPELYLNLTKKFVEKFKQMQSISENV